MFPLVPVPLILSSASIFSIDQSLFRQGIALLVLLSNFASSLSISDILSKKMETLRLWRESDEDMKGDLGRSAYEKSWCALAGRKSEGCA